MAPVNVSGGEVKAGPVSAPVIPLILIGIGMYLSWFGVHYWRSDTKWPTDPIKDTLQGKGVPAANTPPSYASQDQAQLSQAQLSQATGIPAGGNTPAGNTSASDNQALAKSMAKPYGWDSGQQWADLVSLWNRESGWSNTAKNPTSGAYGIPQALPATKMPQAAQAPPIGISDPRSQIQWGLQDIAQTYGSPSVAWAHEQALGWY